MILTVRFQEVPWVPEEERLQVESLVEGFWRVQANFGFKDEPDVPRVLGLCMRAGLAIDQSALSYFLSREIVILTRGAGMAHWREALFATMARNAGSVGDFLRLSPAPAADAVNAVSSNSTSLPPASPELCRLP